MYQIAVAEFRISVILIISSFVNKSVVFVAFKEDELAEHYLLSHWVVDMTFYCTLRETFSPHGQQLCHLKKSTNVFHLHSTFLMFKVTV